MHDAFDYFLAIMADLDVGQRRAAESLRCADDMKRWKRENARLIRFVVNHPFLCSHTTVFWIIARRSDLGIE